MAVFNFLDSVTDFFENKVAGNFSGSAEIENPEELLREALDGSIVCIFSHGKMAGIQQAIAIVKASGVGRVDVLNIKNFAAHNLTAPDGEKNDENEIGCSVVDLSGASQAFIDRFLLASCRKTFPLVFIKGDCVGGLTELKALSDKNLLPEYFKKHDYDLIVIGGGSGGLAASKRAASKSKKVAVLDFVKPTPIGTTWGLGGTCVNVGCIPKKLMHQAAILGKSLEDARKFGWQFGTEVQADWKMLVSGIKNHILGLNYGAKIELRKKDVNYVNGYGSFVNSHTIKAVQKDGKEILMSADRFLVATGLRPRYLDVHGAKEFCITSDDLFTLPYPPGKTLVVGASYVALECGGFLKGVGFDVTVMVRSILLRGFDQDMAERIGKHMEGHGIKFVRKAIPTKIEKVQDGNPGLYRVTHTQTTDDGEIEGTEEYNTILLAIGRDAVTDEVNLDGIGVTRNKAKKLVCWDNEQSVSVPHIYGIGDVSEGRPELTPAAIQAGKALMERLFGTNFDSFDYQNVPTTVFTPLEYGCCGLSEEAANKKFGNKTFIFHSRFTPLEFTVPKRKLDIDGCYAKVIFTGDANKPRQMRVVGLHFLGPNAGEVTQGFGIALKLKATMDDFKNLVGIHPTVAEVFTFPTMEPKSDAPLAAGGC